MSSPRSTSWNPPLGALLKARDGLELAWVHCARTDKYTLITCHPKRGTNGIDDAGVLARFRGVAVHVAACSLCDA